MTTFTPDDRVVEFQTRLTATARRNYQAGMVSHAHLIKAFTNGWTPAKVAAGVSDSLPTSNAWRVIQTRLEWFANHTPTAPKGTRVRAHVCNHPDGHECPWLDELDAAGKAIPCGCR